MTAKTIGTNKVGKRYALVASQGRWSVWARCANYDRHVRDGIAYTWRYCAKDLDEHDARVLFERKINGRQK